MKELKETLEKLKNMLMGIEVLLHLKTKLYSQTQTRLAHTLQYSLHNLIHVVVPGRMSVLTCTGSKTES